MSLIAMMAGGALVAWLGRQWAEGQEIDF